MNIMTTNNRFKIKDLRLKNKQKSNLKSYLLNPKSFFMLGLLVYFSAYLFPPFAQGEMMSNTNYQIQKRDIEIGPPKKPTPTPTREPAKPYAYGENYKVETNSPSGFAFSLSLNELNFEKPTATNPVIRLLYLTVTSPSSYQILAGQDHQLTAGDKTIPDTTCDNGQCTQDSASGWTSALTYGFGYQTTALGQNNFRQFSDLSKNELLETLFFHTGGNNKQDKVIYKVNVSSTQQTGAYTNVVTYIAIPNY
jgi:hypothetical protein